MLTVSDSSQQTTQNVLRTLYLRRGGGTVSPEKPRIAGRGVARNQSVPSARGRLNTKINGDGSRTAQLLASAHEDIARLIDVLRNQQCAAALRGIDGVIMPINTSAVVKRFDGRGHTPNDTLSPPREACQIRGAAPSLSAPIYDAGGGALASLELSLGNISRSECSEKLLGALLESTARSMTERWFRLTHFRQWIVIAVHQKAAHLSVILAVDRDQRVVSADRNAIQLLQQTARRFEKRAPLTTFFQPSGALFRGRGYGDAAITLRDSADGQPWIALVTPPAVGAVMGDHDPRAMLHVRPRWDCLTRLLSMPSDLEAQRGLSSCALKRIEEYIDANLDSALEIDELAALVRMSPSHFTRSFNRSVGLTPHRYVIHCRVAKARELLATTDLPLIEVALNIGFSDQSHFSRRFQELVGVPPGAYRRSGNSGLGR